MIFKFKLIISFIGSIIIINEAQNLNFQAHLGSLRTIRGVSFTNDNKVITTSDEQNIKIWDPLKNWTLSYSFQNAFSPIAAGYSYLNKNGILAASTGPIANVWNITNSITLIKSFQEGTAQINALTMNSNNILATAAEDMKIKIWDFNFDNPIITLYGHTGFVYSLTFLNDSIVVSGAGSNLDFSIKIWSITTITNSICLRTLIGHTSIVHSILILSNELIATGSGDKSIKIWNITDSSCMVTLNGHTGAIRSMTKITDSIIASAGQDSLIKVWNLIDYKNTSIYVPNQSYRSISYSFELDVLAAGQTNGFLLVWFNFSSLISPISNSIQTKYMETDKPFSTIQFDSSVLSTTKTNYETKSFYTTIIIDSSITPENFDSTTSKLLDQTTQIFSTESILIDTSMSTTSKIIETSLSKSIETSFSYSTKAVITINTSPLIIDQLSSTHQSDTSITNHVYSDTKYSDKTISTSNIEESTTTNSKLIIETSTFSPKNFSLIEINDANEMISNLFLKNDSLVSFDSILSPHLPANDSNNLKLMIAVLIQTKYDLNDCLSNCSNHGKCKLSDNNKTNCECDLFFDGSKCHIDLRPCSYPQCLNSIKCENIFSTTNPKEIDFKCECKSKLFYGKRCEKKINLCQNETCSGNGLCKIINENELNETIKCECFGAGFFEGEKCEIKTYKQIIIKTAIKTTTYIAIFLIFVFILFIISLDLHRFLTKTRSTRHRLNNKNKNKPTQRTR